MTATLVGFTVNDGLRPCLSFYLINIERASMLRLKQGHLILSTDATHDRMCLTETADILRPHHHNCMHSTVLLCLRENGTAVVVYSPRPRPLIDDT